MIRGLRIHEIKHASGRRTEVSKRAVFVYTRGPAREVTAYSTVLVSMSGSVGLTTTTRDSERRNRYDLQRLRPNMCSVAFSDDIEFG